MSYRFVLPLYIYLPRKTKKDKKIPLSMNWYRNAQHQESAHAKRLFKPISCEPWDGIAPRIKISYHVQKTTRARYDVMNFVAVIDKFFCDWLVNEGMIEDDDYSRVVYGDINGTAMAGESRCVAVVEIMQNDALQIKP